MNSSAQLIRRLTKKVLQDFPDFELVEDPSATRMGHRLEVRRKRKGYGSFSDTDKMRQVQRDLLHVLRASGYKVHLGREDRDGFVARVEDPTRNPDPVDLQDEVRKALSSEPRQS